MIQTPEIRFTDALLTRPAVSRQDVVTSLAHFAIVTYAVEPERLRPHVHERFAIETFRRSWAKRLVSAVPFEDQDFCFVGARSFKFRFGQKPSHLCH